MLDSRRYNDACRFMGAALSHTGGNCTALYIYLREGAYLLLTTDGEPIAPSDLLDGPVVVGFYEGDVSEPASEETFPTLLAAFRDIYGKAEGTDWPDELADL